jgi:hypothetical protein
MPRKKPNSTPSPCFSALGAERFVVVSSARRAAVIERIGGSSDGWIVVDRPPTHTAARPLIVVDEISCGGCETLVRDLISNLGARVVMIAADCDAMHVMNYMRAGAADVLLPSDSTTSNSARLIELADTAGSPDQALARQSLVRDKLLQHLQTMCDHLSRTCKSLSDNMQNISVASEFNAVVRQELDMENLLRTVLELVLRKTGPTNAALFLPGVDGDFTLGAYANYDCSRESIDPMFDELAGVIGPKFEQLDAPIVMADVAQLRDQLGASSHWVEHSTMLIVSCKDAAGECRAVMTLFRDRRATFNESMIRTVGLMAGITGAQLERVVKTHNRHTQKSKWMNAGDDIDLAA